MSHVNLGYMSQTESWHLHSCFFPSKVGGKPSWLDFSGLPTTELQCEHCGLFMSFLCQVYAPIDNKPECFHRTIFVFVCRQAECYTVDHGKANFVALRCQLPRDNEIYYYEPCEYRVTHCFELDSFAKLCSVCGIVTRAVCSKCQITPYCCQLHQKLDWKAGHKRKCATILKLNTFVLFDEFELSIEEEVLDSTDDEDEVESRNLAEYNKMVAENRAGTMQDVPEQEFLDYRKVGVDKTFLRFKKRVACNPHQVLRYEKSGKPLWIAKNKVGEPKIPDCEFCGAERQFEFQVLPQMLTKLQEYVVDFGILCIYTCKNSCSEGSNYKKEFVFKQDVDNSPVNEDDDDDDDEDDDHE